MEVMTVEKLKSEVINGKTLDEIDDAHYQNLEKLRVEAEAAVAINKNMIVEEYMKTISNLQQYAFKLANERKLLQYLNRKKQAVYYSILSELENEVLSKTQQECRINKNSTYQLINSYCDQQEQIIKVMEDMMATLKSKTFALKGIQEQHRQDMGL